MPKRDPTGMSDDTSTNLADVASAAPAATGPSRRKTEFLAFAELFALSGVAIAQPLLDLLSKNTGIFVAHRTTGIEAVALVVLILFVVPLAGWGIELAAGLISTRLRRLVHGALAGLFIG